MLFTVGSGRGLDSLGKEISPQGTPPSSPLAEDDSTHCPELSVEEMTSTTMTTDTSSSVTAPRHPPPPSTTTITTTTTTNGNSHSTSANGNVTGASNSCEYSN